MIVEELIKKFDITVDVYNIRFKGKLLRFSDEDDVIYNFKNSKVKTFGLDVTPGQWNELYIDLEEEQC